MRTLLYVSSRPVWQTTHGNSRRLATLLPALRSIWRVVLSSPDEPVSVDFAALDAHHFTPADGAGLTCHSVERLIRIESPAAIVLGAGAECLAFRRTRIWPTIVVDRGERTSRLGARLGCVAYEWRLLRAVAQTIVASEEDRRFLSRLNKRALITAVDHTWAGAAARYSAAIDEGIKVARDGRSHEFREFALGT